MAQYVCEVCGHVYDEEKEGITWKELPENWTCPVCDSPKSYFHITEEQPDSIASEGHPASEQTADTAVQATVSERLIDTMVAWGVEVVFGMVGHSNLGLADAIRLQCERGNLKFIGVRHEGAAAFAASAYGKLSGKPAACLAIAGPGATNLLTGLWDAKLDRVPILALTGQVDIQFLGPGNFQELDLSSAFNSVAAWSQTVLSESQHAELMSLALKHAIQKRDVAHLIIPNQIQDLTVSAEEAIPDSTGRLARQDILPSSASLEQSIEMLTQAERPVIIVGYGARSSMRSIIAFAEQAQIPVITTFKGKGLIPDQHPLACGVLGRSGTPVTADFMDRADLLIVLGASFSKHTGIAKDKATIQVDFDASILGKFHPVTLPVWGEITKTVDYWRETCEAGDSKSDSQQEVAQQWAAWRQEKARRAQIDQGNGLNSALIFQVLSEHIPANAVIAVDVGNNTYSFGRYFESKGQAVLMSGYLGSIGYGVPAAIGAWAAAPERPIVAVTGDGGFGQYMGELTTAVKYNIPIKHILLNNSELGKISKEQRVEGKTVWETTLHNPNFAQFAENCGAWGLRVRTRKELETGIQALFDSSGPGLLEIISDSELI